MSSDACRRAARDLIATVPLMMQAVASELRGREHFMPMPHFRALMILAHLGPQTTTDLAQKQRVSLPTMSNTVSVLVEHGWVERVADATDRRRAELRLTECGQDAVRRMHEQMQAFLMERLGPASDDDLEKVSAGLAVLRTAFAGPGFPGREDVA